MFKWLKEHMVKGAQKAVVAGVTAGAAVVVAKYPVLAPVLSPEHVANVAEIAQLAVEVLVMSGIGYGVTWWKENRKD